VLFDLVLFGALRALEDLSGVWVGVSTGSCIMTLPIREPHRRDSQKVAGLSRRVRSVIHLFKAALSGESLRVSTCVLSQHVQHMQLERDA